MCHTHKDNSHHAKFANHGTPDIWEGYIDGNPIGTYWVLNPRTKKIILTRDMTFLKKSYWDYNEKPVLATMTYEGSDDEEELERVSVVNQNINNYNEVSDSKSESDNKSEENLFDVDIDKEVEATPKITISAKVVGETKQLQALYNDDANKIVEQAAQEKSANEKLNFFIDQAMVASDTKSSLDKLQMFSEAWNCQNKESQ